MYVPLVRPMRRTSGRSLLVTLALVALVTGAFAQRAAVADPGTGPRSPGTLPGTPADAPGIGAAPTGPPVPMPDHPRGLPAQANWGSAIEAPAPYQPQLSCAAGPLKGTAKLRDLLLRAYDHGGNGGAIRSCASGGQSEHKDGRAFDWMLSMGNPAERRTAGDFLSWLIKPGRDGKPGAMARRLGIMYVIYNRKIWASYSPGWRDYSGSDPHTSHIHISLSWNGARGTTSFWKGRVAPVDYGTCVFFGGSPAVAAAGSPTRTTPCPEPKTSPRGSSRPFAWLGNSGDSVRRAQHLLGVSATGTLNTTTRKKLLSYQLSHDLPRTGALDKPTWASLEPGSRTQSVPSWRPRQAARWGIEHGSPELHRSSAGTAVYALQVALGMPDRLRTGFLGQRTSASVGAFRAAHGMTNTPQVDAEVWDLLAG